MKYILQDPLADYSLTFQARQLVEEFVAPDLPRAYLTHLRAGKQDNSNVVQLAKACVARGIELALRRLDPDCEREVLLARAAEVAGTVMH